MRILMLTWEYPPRVIGGIAHVVSELSRALAREGNEVEVVTALEEGLPEMEKNDGVTVHRVAPYHGRPLNFFAWVHQLNLAMLEKGVRLCQKDHFDLVHAHDWLVAYAGRGLKHIFQIPLFASVHATEFGRNHGLHNDEQRYIGEVEWSLTYEAWRVICNSSYMRDEVEGVFNLPSDKISVIPNGIRPEAFQVSAPDPEVRQRFAAPNEKIIFFIGRLVREKGVQVLLEALLKIREEIPNVRAIIAGQGPYAEELHRHALNRGLDRQVTFAGYIDEKTRNQLYAHADVAVFPSLYEPFGLVALEAMATGTPVVVSDTGGFAETVKHGENGIRVSVENVAELAEQLCVLLTDSKSARRLAQQARQDIARDYSWFSIARQYEKIYQQIIFSSEARRWHHEGDRPEPVVQKKKPVASAVSPRPSRYT